jgi:hypothetical protein
MTHYIAQALSIKHYILWLSSKKRIPRRNIFVTSRRPLSAAPETSQCYPFRNARKAAKGRSSISTSCGVPPFSCPKKILGKEFGLPRLLRGEGNPAQRDAAIGIVRQGRQKIGSRSAPRKVCEGPGEPGLPRSMSPDQRTRSDFSSGFELFVAIKRRSSARSLTARPIALSTMATPVPMVIQLKTSMISLERIRMQP